MSMKATKENFKTLCRVHYELRGFSYILSSEYWAHVYSNNNTTFLREFWALRNEIKELIKKGCICRYPIYVNGQKLPYLVNSLNL